MIKANVLRILTMLIRAYQDETKSGEMLREKKNAMKRLERALLIANAHYCEKITLEEVTLWRRFYELQLFLPLFVSSPTSASVIM